MIFNAENKNIKIAADLLIRGKIIAYPTDTLYGMGVDATNTDSIDKLNTSKGRKSPLSIIVGSIKMLKRYAEVFDSDMRYLNKFLPGKFTFFLNEKHSNISNKVTLNTGKIGIRIPDSDFIVNVVNCIDRPVITTSINIHGEKPINDINKIEHLFSDVNIFTDNTINESNGSTIIDLVASNGPKIIRKGDGIFNL